MEPWAESPCSPSETKSYWTDWLTGDEVPVSQSVAAFRLHFRACILMQPQAEGDGRRPAGPSDLND